MSIWRSKQNLTIIPVINKIDLPHANVAQAKQQLEDILAIPGDTAILASAKEGHRHRGHPGGHRRADSAARSRPAERTLAGAGV